MCQVVLRTDLCRRLDEKKTEEVITVPPSKYKANQLLCTSIATIKNNLYVSVPLEPLSALRTRFYHKNLLVTFMWLKF